MMELSKIHIKEWLEDRAGTSPPKAVLRPTDDEVGDNTHGGFLTDLFSTCLNTVSVLRLNTGPRRRRVGRNVHQKLTLLADAFVGGKLESCLSTDEELYEKILDLLYRVGRLISKICEGPRGITKDLKRNHTELKQHLDQAKEILAATTSDSDSSSTSEDGAQAKNSSMSGSFKGAHQASLNTYVDLMMDLCPILEQTYRDQHRARPPHLVSTPTFKVTHAAMPYVQLVRDKFPLADQLLVERLGEANWQRHEQLRRVKEGPSSEDPANLLASTAKSQFHPMALFKDSALGSSIAPQSQRAETVASHSSFVSSNQESEKNHFRVPNFPKDAVYGEPFSCPFCDKTLSSIKNRIEWKLHVFADLQAYICLDADCPDMLKLFQSRKSWFEHESSQHLSLHQFHCQLCDLVSGNETELLSHVLTHHGIDVSNPQMKTAVLSAARKSFLKNPADLQCRLCCRKNFCVTPRDYATHVGRELEEVALSVLPPQEDDEQDDEFSLNADEEEDDSIRCICGYIDDDGNTVYCPKCKTWQHIQCYYPSRKLPEEHYCTDCVPRDDLDAERAHEQQKRHREALDGGDRKLKRPPSTRSKKTNQYSVSAAGQMNEPHPSRKGRGERRSASPSSGPADHLETSAANTTRFLRSSRQASEKRGQHNSAESEEEPLEHPERLDSTRTELDAQHEAHTEANRSARNTRKPRPMAAPSSDSESEDTPDFDSYEERKLGPYPRLWTDPRIGDIVTRDPMISDENNDHDGSKHVSHDPPVDTPGESAGPAEEHIAQSPEAIVEKKSQDKRTVHDPPNGAEWERYKPIIAKLLMNPNLRIREVRDMLKTQYGFTATEKMYRTRIKQWSIRRNNTRADKSSILRKSGNEPQASGPPSTPHIPSATDLEHTAQNSSVTDAQQSPNPIPSVRQESDPGHLSPKESPRTEHPEFPKGKVRGDEQDAEHLTSGLGHISDAPEDAEPPSSSSLRRQRTRSFVPSLYSMGSKHSGEAIVLPPRKPVPPEQNDLTDSMTNSADHQIPETSTFEPSRSKRKEKGEAMSPPPPNQQIKKTVPNRGNVIFKMKNSHTTGGDATFWECGECGHKQPWRYRRCLNVRSDGYTCDNLRSD